MNNVQDVGHCREQTTKVSNLRPELAVFHGYTFERTSNVVIEVWLPTNCDACEAEIRINSFFVRTGSATDEDILRHGLKKFEGTKPTRGLKFHSASPFHCEPCHQRWLKGEGLETTGMVKYRKEKWNPSN